MLKADKAFLKNKTDIKIFILFVLNNVRYPLLYQEIGDLVLSDDVVAEFDFAECFSELVELGHVLELSEPSGTRHAYLISESGMEVAASLEDTLLASLRKRSLQYAMRYLSLQKRGAKADAKIERRDDKQYTVTCTVTERGGVLASFSLTLPTEGEARQIREHFLEKPEDVVRGVTAAATGELEYLMSYPIDR